MNTKKTAQEISDELAIENPNYTPLPNNCGTCKHWLKTTNYDSVPNDGNCSILSEKIAADVSYGWDGGYIRGYETEEDFGCVLWEGK